MADVSATLNMGKAAEVNFPFGPYIYRVSEHRKGKQRPVFHPEFTEGSAKLKFAPPGLVGQMFLPTKLQTA